MQQNELKYQQVIDGSASQFASECGLLLGIKSRGVSAKPLLSFTSLFTVQTNYRFISGKPIVYGVSALSFSLWFVLKFKLKMTFLNIF